MQIKIELVNEKKSKQMENEPSQQLKNKMEKIKIEKNVQQERDNNDRRG
jgi:hypothetical protein